MKIYLIRHSLTAGNLERRYIGRTDEELCREGRALLDQRMKRGVYPAADRIFTSPMKRCVQTAQIIYPGRELAVIDALAECDFGRFENKNYEELKDRPEYQRWLEGCGTLGFPGGESKDGFAARILEGFAKALKLCGYQRTEPDAGCGAEDRGNEPEVTSAAFVVHGGTIMSNKKKYAFPKGEYYDFQIGNGEGYELILADVPASGGGLYPGSYVWGSGVALPSGADDGTFGHMAGKNYKTLPS